MTKNQTQSYKEIINNLEEIKKSSKRHNMIKCLKILRLANEIGQEEYIKAIKDLYKLEGGILKNES